MSFQMNMLRPFRENLHVLPAVCFDPVIRELALKGADLDPHDSAARAHRIDEKWETAA